MPTPNERKALIFFSAVALLGGVVRVAGAVRDEPVAATAESRAALARQISAVDSARQRAARKKGGGKARGARGGAGPAVADEAVDGPRAVDRVASEPAAGGAAVGLAAVRAPVEVRYASAGEVGAARSGVRGAGARVPAVPAVPVDVDVASAAELEALPRVGPALARRIVANRDSLGAFGSVGGLRRVRGIGPAVALGLTPYVTFSGRVRPSDATIGGPDAVRSRGSRGRRVTQ